MCEPPGHSPYILQHLLQPGLRDLLVHCSLTSLTFLPLGTGTHTPGFPEVGDSGCLCPTQRTAGGCRLGATTLLLLLRVPHAQGSLREKLSYLGKNEQLLRPGKPAERRLVVGVWPRLPVESRIQLGPSSSVSLTDI